NFNEHSVIVIDVPSSIKKPVYIKSEGSTKGVYLRAGSNTRRAQHENIEELMRENKRVFFDEKAIHSDLSVLSDDLLIEVYGDRNIKKLISESVVVSAHSAVKKYYPTLAGLLMFCEKPHQYI